MGNSHKEQNESEVASSSSRLLVVSSGGEPHSGVTVEQRRGSGGAAVPPTRVGGRTRGLSAQELVITREQFPKWLVNSKSVDFLLCFFQNRGRFGLPSGG